MGKHKQSTDSLVLKRIKSHKPGWVFTPADFIDLGSRTAVATALKRYKAAGIIRQLTRGLYDLPRHNPVLGALWPSIEAVTKALQGKNGLRLQPAGAYAANLLGLSDQVPAKVIYYTDGASRSIKAGPMQINFKRTTPRNMAVAGRLSGLVIQAFRELGKQHITPERIARMRKLLPIVERRSLLKDLTFAPVWMHTHFHELAKP